MENNMEKQRKPSYEDCKNCVWYGVADIGRPKKCRFPFVEASLSGNMAKLDAKCYKTLLNQPGIDTEQMQREMKARGILSICDREELYTLFDRGNFQDIVRGYVYILLDWAEDLPEAYKEEVAQNLRFIFDGINAEEAEAYFYRKGEKEYERKHTTQV